MICHAPEAAPFPVFPLALAMISPNLRVRLVAPVGPQPLLASHPASALLSAVDLPPVAGAADGEHRPATRPSAKQLVPLHLSGQGASPARFHSRLRPFEGWTETPGAAG